MFAKFATAQCTFLARKTPFRIRMTQDSLAQLPSLPFTPSPPLTFRGTSQGPPLCYLQPPLSSPLLLFLTLTPANSGHSLPQQALLLWRGRQVCIHHRVPALCSASILISSQYLAGPDGHRGSTLQRPLN